MTATTTTPALISTVTAAEQLHGLSLNVHVPSLQAAALFTGDKPGLSAVQVLPATNGGTLYLATNGHIACRIWHHAAACPAEGLGALGWAIEASSINGKRLTKAQALSSEGLADVTCFVGQWQCRVTKDRLDLLRVHPIAELAATGRKANSLPDVLPSIERIWPEKVEPGLSGHFNAAYLAVLHKAADVLVKAEVEHLNVGVGRDRVITKVGERTPLLSPGTSADKGAHRPTHWGLRLNDGQSAAFLVMPVQVREA